MKPKLDYALCTAAGQDAGNRNMRRNGRTAWNEEDWNVAAETANELLDSIGYPMPESEVEKC